MFVTSILLRELADRGSVAAVAAATHRTPSAVSQQLRTAQSEFGVPLVEPHGRGVRLTEAGSILAEGGRDIARSIAEVQATWDAFRGQPTGRSPSRHFRALPRSCCLVFCRSVRHVHRTRLHRPRHRRSRIRTSRHRPRHRDRRTASPRSAPEGSIWTSSTRPRTARHRHADRPPTRGRHGRHGRSGRRTSGTASRSAIRSTRCESRWKRRLAGQSGSSSELRDNRLVEALVADSDRLAVLPRFTTPTGLGVDLRPLSGIRPDATSSPSCAPTARSASPSAACSRRF